MTLKALVTVVGIDQEEPIEALLWVCSGRFVGQRFTLNSDEHIIGRSDAADIQIGDDRISQLHARIATKGGTHVLYDSGSSNGTYVNDERVDEIVLQHGDLIQVGTTVLKYLTVEADKKDPITVTQTGTEIGPVPAGLRERAQQALYMARTGAEVKALAPVPHYAPPPPPHRPAQAYVVTEEERELTLLELFAQLRRTIAFFWPFRRLIAGMTVVGVVLGIGTYFVLPPARKAIFEISLVAKPSENPVQRFERSNIEFFRSAEQNFKSPTLIARTLTDMGDNQLTPARIKEVQERLEFSAVGPQSPNTYKGSYSSPVSDESVKFLDSHVRLYLDTEIEKTLKVIKVESQFLEEELEEAAKDLRRTEAELLEFKKKNIDGLPEQARQYYDYLFELQRRQGEADREINRANALARIDRSKLTTEQPLVESRILDVRPYQSAIVDLNRKMAEGRAGGMGPEHPEMQRMGAELEEMKRLAKSSEELGTQTSEVEKRRNPAYQRIQDDLHSRQVSAETARKEASRIQRDLAKVKGIVDRLPELEATYAELTRSYDATKALHTRIFENLKTTQLQLELERASAAARYDIITPPQLEFSSPLNRMMRRALLLGFMGFVIGIAIAAFKQLSSRVIVEDLRQKSEILRTSVE